MKHTLYTYRGLSDLRRIEEEHEIVPFIVFIQ